MILNHEEILIMQIEKKVCEIKYSGLCETILHLKRYQVINLFFLTYIGLNRYKILLSF